MLTQETKLSQNELELMDAWWRAANYLTVGQIYLKDNPLLRRPLTLQDVKPRLLGHWGTTPGLNFIYVHLNRVIQKYRRSVLYIAGPGHGGPGIVANTYLEGTYSELYPDITEDEEGLARFCKQFSFPGGIPSHVAPEVPGSLHEGGELGYSLSHAYGAVFDNPDLIAACVIGDGEAETGALAAAWHSNIFLNPETDGAVLPILHLNGYKIANPTILARIPTQELEMFFRGHGYEPFLVEGEEAEAMHRDMAHALDQIVERIHEIWHYARTEGSTARPQWPVLILRTPKGWTGPDKVDGKRTEGSWRSHQVPLSKLAERPEHLEQLEQWLLSYRPEELFDEKGRLNRKVRTLAPQGEWRMSANPHSNGGLLLRDLRMPSFRDYAVEVTEPGATIAEATRVLGRMLRDVIGRNPDNFRLFGPDETASNRLDAVFEATERTWYADLEPGDGEGGHLARNGRVMEVLSEHTCQGWLEGYLLTGRHGLFSCYEAFIHIVDSMVNQHAKWLKTIGEIPWRHPIASLNYLLTSHVWRQDHNGYSHQDPGFIDHVANKKASVVRVYLPPDANTLLCVADHCLRSRNFINVIVAGKQPSPQYLDIESAVKHCRQGLGLWRWASNDQPGEPDLVMACAGDVPTMETLAAVELLWSFFPELKIRTVNVIDLMTLQPPSKHPHGVSDDDFDSLFTRDKPVVFAYHGYPPLIHRLTYRRFNHNNIHVHGYNEEGTTTTPFDMCVLNELDRFHLALAAIDHVPSLRKTGAHAKQWLRDKLIEHKEYVHNEGQDLPEIRNWKWNRKDQEDELS